MHQPQLNFVLLSVLLVISSICGNCVAFPGKGTKSSDLTNGSLRFPETSESETRIISPSEENVKDNLIQSGESDGSSKTDDLDFTPKQEDSQDRNSKQIFEKDSVRNEGQTQLSKFYRYGISPRSAMNPSSSPDSIIFPAAERTSETSSNPFPASSFSDRYNRHRPNIPTPQVSIPFNFGYGLPPPFPPTHPVFNNRRSQGQGQQQRQSLRSSSSNDFLTREQDDILYQNLVELFRGLFTRQRQLRSDQQPEASFNRIAFAQPSTLQISPTSISSTTVTAEKNGTERVEEVDGVNYQSLYSGPKLDKSLCPNGMHRTHGGSCHEKSPRKLLRSSG